MPHNKGYKILSFRDKHGDVYKLDMGGQFTTHHEDAFMSFSLEEMLMYTDSFIEIHSVQRLGDSKIFQLNTIPHYLGKVTQIEIDLPTLRICIAIEFHASAFCVFIEK